MNKSYQIENLTAMINSQTKFLIIQKQKKITYIMFILRGSLLRIEQFPNK